MGGHRGRLLALLAASLALTAVAIAQPRNIDPATSTLTVRVYKAGMLGAFGHDHEIAAPIARGTADPTARQVELRVNTASMRVRDPNSSEKDRGDIEKTMLGAEVLDAAKYPEIVFRSTGVEAVGQGGWTVKGSLTLHGQTAPVALDVREQGGHYVGKTRFKQTDFGIQPVKVAGGTIRVKDEIQIEFDIQLAR